MTEMSSQAVRLSQTSIDTLTALSRKYIGNNPPLRLFGSRINDRVRGGDIDILYASKFQLEIQMSDYKHLLNHYH